MRIESIHLKNFKRFTDLLIRGIPDTARLVVLVGPSGCGKSSLFDALLQWYRRSVGFGVNGDQLYFRKDPQESFDWYQIVNVTLHRGASPRRGSIYIRSAYRNEPDFSVTGVSRPNVPSEAIRLNRLIENDQTVSENYHRLVYDTTAALYNAANDEKTVRTLREELIGQVRASMEGVFGDLILNNITDPLGEGSFFFKKGATESFHYKNLSGGEKAAFDLILDLHIKKKYFDEAIYCIDEVESHLHTRLQGRLVRELVNIIPQGSQLWITTHALGVLRAAQELEANQRGSVCIIDFEGINPDVPTELLPVALDRVVWEKFLSIAVDDLSRRITPRVIVICEGSSAGNRRKDFDAEIYNKIFGREDPEVVFISGGSWKEVLDSADALRSMLEQLLRGTRIVTLVDRDDRTDSEVACLEKSGCVVLAQRNLESYLFEDDVIRALLEREGKPHLVHQALDIKQQAITNSKERGKPRDDIKSAAGEIYVGLKKLLQLQRCGSNVDAFMRDTLAPMIQPPMPTYQKLKADVWEKILRR
jgi:predicted ATPase